MGLLLAIDSCQNACSIALLAEEQVLAERVEILPRGHAEIILSMLAGTLSDAGAGIADVGRIAVTVGPGSFTGVRVGLSTANGFSIARECIMTGLTSFEAVAAQYLFATPSFDGMRIMTLVAGRQGQYFHQTFDIDREASWPLAAIGGPGRESLKSCLAHAEAEGAVPVGVDMLEQIEEMGHEDSARLCIFPIVRPGLMGKLALLAPAERWQRPRPLYLRAVDIGPGNAHGQFDREA